MGPSRAARNRTGVDLGPDSCDASHLATAEWNAFIHGRPVVSSIFGSTCPSPSRASPGAARV